MAALTLWANQSRSGETSGPPYENSKRTIVAQVGQALCAKDVVMGNGGSWNNRKTDSPQRISSESSDPAMRETADQAVSQMH